MNMRNKLAAAMPFAHLMGLVPAASQAAKGGRAEEDRERDAEDDEDEPKGRKAKGKRAEDERDEKDEARAEDADEEDGSADEDEDGDEPKGRKAKGKRARRAEDDDPEAADEDDEAKAVRADERARCAAIVAHGLRSGCVEQACVFAFDTSLSKTAAINALTAGQAAGGGRKPQSLAERMNNAKVNHVGAEGGGDAPAGMSKAAAAIIRAAEAAGGRR